MSEPAAPERRPRRPRRSELEELVGIGMGVTRLTLGAGWRTAMWSADTSLRASRRIARAAVSGESPAQLIDGLAKDTRETLRRFLGVDGDRPAELDADVDGPEPAPRDPEELRRLGADLLARSADVDGAGRAHPAYARIVAELAPDEGRILRLLKAEGPQPAVDVRSSKVPLVTSELVAPGLNMIGREAGVADLEKTPAYLNNLERLGLIWFSREPLPDPLDYQVLEAQPEVLEALKRVGRGRTVRRSIHLTPFGDDFCETVLPIG